MKLVSVIVLTVFSIYLTHAQSVTGVIYNNSEEPIVGAEVFLSDQQTVTNGLGKFTFNNLGTGTYKLSVQWDEFRYDQDGILVGTEDLDLGIINVEGEKKLSDDIDIAVITINADDAGGSDDDFGSEYSSLLTASRDPFVAAAAYQFSGGRFFPRGYNNEDRHLFLDGFIANDLDDGRVLWGAWGGLNDVLRNQDNNFTLQPSNFGFGGIGGMSYIDLSASSQRPQTKIVYNYGNRSYTNRFMITHSSGEQMNGWSYSLSASRRWGDSGYVDGTFYDGYSFFGSIEKKISNHSIGLTVLGAPTNRGRFTGSVQEAYDLAGSNYYNANWGYQNGEVRNSRQYRINQPIAILKHKWQVNDNFNLTTSIGGQTGKFGSTRLDWYEANDPRPDYYRKLPSYFAAEGQLQIAEDVRQSYLDDPSSLQLDWDRFYEINRNRQLTIENVNNSGNTENVNLSAYVLEEQRFDTDKFNVNTVFESFLSDRVTVNGGINYMYENTHNFRVIDDLLGGEYYINLDQFALRDFPNSPELAQNDLQEPNKLLQVGDKYGFNYDIVTQKYGGWGQVQFNLKKVDIYAGLELSGTSFYRDGFFQNGRFPDNSLGKSEVQSFLNYGTKLGATFKIDGRNYLYGVATARTRAPFSRFAYISPRTRDDVVTDLTSEKIYGGEIGYILRYAGIKGRISAYYTQFQDQIKNNSFYNDQERTFVNFVLSGVDKKHQGIEFGLEAALTSTLEFNAAAAITANQYTSRPSGTYTADNSAEVLAENRTIYIKNYYIPGPQQAYSVGLEYNSPKFWFVSMNLNYFNNIYIDINPDRRTDEAVDGLLLPDRSETFNEVIAQQEMPAQFLLNLFGGKSWKIGDSFLFLNLSVNNLLDNKGFVTGGFEQGRFDYEGKDINRFPPRLFYAYGRTYSVGFSLRL